MPVVEDLTSDEFGIQFGERTYPSVTPKEVSGTPIPEVVADDPSDLMQRTLASSILATLPFLNLPSSVTEKSTLFAAYVDSVSLLHRYREDVRTSVADNERSGSAFNSRGVRKRSSP